MKNKESVLPEEEDIIVISSSLLFDNDHYLALVAVFIIFMGCPQLKLPQTRLRRRDEAPESVWTHAIKGDCPPIFGYMVLMGIHKSQQRTEMIMMAGEQLLPLLEYHKLKASAFYDHTILPD